MYVSFKRLLRSRDLYLDKIRRKKDGSAIFYISRYDPPRVDDVGPSGRMILKIKKFPYGSRSLDRVVYSILDVLVRMMDQNLEWKEVTCTPGGDILSLEDISCPMTTSVSQLLPVLGFPTVYSHQPLWLMGRVNPSTPLHDGVRMCPACLIPCAPRCPRCGTVCVIQTHGFEFALTYLLVQTKLNLKMVQDSVRYAITIEANTGMVIPHNGDKVLNSVHIIVKSIRERVPSPLLSFAHRWLQSLVVELMPSYGFTGPLADFDEDHLDGEGELSHYLVSFLRGNNPSEIPPQLQMCKEYIRDVSVPVPLLHEIYFVHDEGEECAQLLIPSDGFNLFKLRVDFVQIDTISIKSYKYLYPTSRKSVFHLPGQVTDVTLMGRNFGIHPFTNSYYRAMDWHYRSKRVGGKSTYRFTPRFVNSVKCVTCDFVMVRSLPHGNCKSRDLWWDYFDIHNGHIISTPRGKFKFIHPLNLPVCDNTLKALENVNNCRPHRQFVDAHPLRSSKLWLNCHGCSGAAICVDASRSSPLGPHLGHVVEMITGRQIRVSPKLLKMSTVFQMSYFFLGRRDHQYLMSRELAVPPLTFNPHHYYGGSPLEIMTPGDSNEHYEEEVERSNNYPSLIDALSDGDLDAVDVFSGPYM